MYTPLYLITYMYTPLYLITYFTPTLLSGNITSCPGTGITTSLIVYLLLSMSCDVIGSTLSLYQHNATPTHYLLLPDALCLVSYDQITYHRLIPILLDPV